MTKVREKTSKDAPKDSMFETTERRRALVLIDEIRQLDWWWFSHPRFKCYWDPLLDFIEVRDGVLHAQVIAKLLRGGAICRAKGAFCAESTKARFRRSYQHPRPAALPVTVKDADPVWMALRRMRRDARWSSDFEGESRDASVALARKNTRAILSGTDVLHRYWLRQILKPRQGDGLELIRRHAKPRDPVSMALLCQELLRIGWHNPVRAEDAVATIVRDRRLQMLCSFACMMDDSSKWELPRVLLFRSEDLLSRGKITKLEHQLECMRLLLAHHWSKRRGYREFLTEVSLLLPLRIGRRIRKATGFDPFWGTPGATL